MGGFLLLLGGILILLFNLGVLDLLQPGLEYVVAGLAAISGLGFLAYYAYDRAQWWPVLPGLTLIGVGAMIYLSTQEAARGEVLTSLLFLALAIAFAIVYLADPHNWWAIIPGGILLVIGAVVLLNQRLSPDLLGALLFVGIGLVFCLVYLLGPVKREVWWALIPGIALITSGLFIYVLTAGREQLLAKLWPLVPVGGGLFLLGRALARVRATPVEPIPPPTAAEPASPASIPPEEPVHPPSKTVVIELEEPGKDAPQD
jgi:hypothetical protein